MSLVASPVGALESAVGKARWRLIPLLSICYLVAYMDRVNISFAAESMNHDLHFTPKIYGFGAGLFFLTYALCEIPSNRLLLHFGAPAVAGTDHVDLGTAGRGDGVCEVAGELLWNADVAGNRRGGVFPRSDFLSGSMVSEGRAGQGNQFVLYRLPAE